MSMFRYRGEFTTQVAGGGGGGVTGHINVRACWTQKVRTDVVKFIMHWREFIRTSNTQALKTITELGFICALEKG